MSGDVFAADDQGSSESVLDTLVGDGKKFENVEALAKGKAESDEHISKIEQENADLKVKVEELAKGETKQKQIDDLLEAIKAKTEGSEGDKTMSQEELVALTKSIYQDEKAAETKAANRARGNALVLGEVEGNVEAARLLVAERAQALGMSVEALAGLSETSPEAFATLIKGTSDRTVLPTGSTTQLDGQRTDALGNQGPVLEIDGYKTKAWFDERRKELGVGKFLNDQAIQRELVRSMNGLGERFNN